MSADFNIIVNGIFYGAAYKLIWSGFTWSQAVGIATTQATVDYFARSVLKDMDGGLAREGMILALKVGAVFGLNQLLQGGLLPIAMTTERLAWIILSTPLFTTILFVGTITALRIGIAVMNSGSTHPGPHQGYR